MQLLTSNGASTYLEGNASTSAVTLYHASNSPRLATTSTGIDVTGNISLSVSDGFAYLSNVGTGNAGIYIRGIGANNTLRSHSTGDFRWEVTGNQKMMLDASGNLLVGKASANSNAAGIELHSNDIIKVTRSGGATGYFNRQTNDGNILELAKDGTAVGSIGSSNAGERLYMVNDSTGLSFIGDFSNIFPCDSSGAPRDNAINLGGVGGRFKDLHLSGTANVDTKIVLDNLSTDYYGTSFQINNTNADFSGALLDMRATSGNVNSVNGRFLRCYSNNGSSEKFHVKGSGEIYTASGILLGGTGSANKLDDYEEGTWTPLFGNNSTTASNGGQFSATYVKIGKLVTVSADITTLTYSGVNLNYMYGLPFAGGVSGVGNGGGGVGYTTTTNIVPGLHVTSNTSAIYFMKLGTNIGGEILSISGKRFIFSLTYETS
jgi:hypothetical protein